jgi:hypothetical protein
VLGSVGPPLRSSGAHRWAWGIAKGGGGGAVGLPADEMGRGFGNRRHKVMYEEGLGKGRLGRGRGGWSGRGLRSADDVAQDTEEGGAAEATAHH